MFTMFDSEDILAIFLFIMFIMFHMYCILKSFFKDLNSKNLFSYGIK